MSSITTRIFFIFYFLFFKHADLRCECNSLDVICSLQNTALPFLENSVYFLYPVGLLIIGFFFQERFFGGASSLLGVLVPAVLISRLRDSEEVSDYSTPEPPVGSLRPHTLEGSEIQRCFNKLLRDYEVLEQFLMTRCCIKLSLRGTFNNFLWPPVASFRPHTLVA